VCVCVDWMDGKIGKNTRKMIYLGMMVGLHVCNSLDAKIRFLYFCLVSSNRHTHTYVQKRHTLEIIIKSVVVVVVSR